MINASAVNTHYNQLTPEERFRLILAAGARGDDAEQDRLINAGRRITLTTSDHQPFARAFDELARLVFIELVEEAARYSDAIERADDDRDFCGDDETEDDDAGEDCDDAEEEQPDPEPSDDDADERPVWQRTLELALAAGFILRTKADGWMQFCERMTVPPFALWEGLPGFDRLQRAFDLAENAAFTPEAMVRWLNATRPGGEPEVQELGTTSAGFAEEMEVMFRRRVEWWGGRAVDLTAGQT